MHVIMRVLLIFWDFSYNQITLTIELMSDPRSVWSELNSASRKDHVQHTLQTIKYVTSESPGCRRPVAVACWYTGIKTELQVPAGYKLFKARFFGGLLRLLRISVWQQTLVKYQNERSDITRKFPGVANRTFGNRTQSNPIARLGSIGFGNRT